MIIFDVETTGLPEPALIPLEQQPRIIEFAAMKVDDDTLERIDHLTFLCDPGIPLPEIITKITGITDADLKGCRKFSYYYPHVGRFFLGQKSIVAHNEPFDHRLLELELMRIDKLTQFPWPMERICTKERTAHLTGKFLKLTELYQLLWGKEPDQKHRALGDVEILHEVCIALREKEIL